MMGEVWLVYSDLWSGQKPWWNWYLTPVVNFSEVRRAQLAKSTVRTSTLVPLEYFQIFLRFVQMLKTEWGAESNGKLPHLFNPWLNCILGSCTCSEGPALGQNTDDDDRMVMLVFKECNLWLSSTNNFVMLYNSWSLAAHFQCFALSFVGVLSLAPLFCFECKIMNDNDVPGICSRH